MTSGNLDEIVGIAINGVAIHAGVSEFGVDAFFPVPYNGRKQPNPIDFDFCLGSGEVSDYYQYYSLSPCIFKSFSKNIILGTLCQEVSTCNSDKTKYMR